jgi:hypothetical protein
MEELSFSISFPGDFWTRYRASRALMHRLWGTWFTYAFFVGLPTVGFVAALIFGWDLSRPGALDLPNWALLLGGYAFMFVFMPLLQLFGLWAATRRNRTLLGMQNHTLSAEGFSTSGDSFSTHLKWDAIHKAIETKHFFFLFISSRGGFYIPKAHIAGASELDQLRAVLKAYLRDKARLRSTT